MRKVAFIWMLPILLAGCSEGPKIGGERPPMPRPGANPPAKMTLDEIATASFGSLSRSAKKEGDAAEFTIAAPKDKRGPRKIFERSVILSSAAIATSLSQDKGLKTVRFITLDPEKPDRKLFTFSIGREAGSKIGGHGSFDSLLGAVKVEQSDPEYKSVTSQATGR